MESKKQTLSKAERTKKLIFESAWSLFRSEGYDNVTIQRITDYAGTAKGSFYTYYTTKSDIIVEGFWMIDGYYRQIETEVMKEETTATRLLRFTELQLQYVRDVIGVEMLKILYSNQILQEGSEKVITDQSRFWHNFITSLIREGQESGECKVDQSAETYAVYFNRAIRGLFLDWNIASGSFDLVEVGMKYYQNFLLLALK